jgi:predicted RNase H-like nuclease (RuvC/YqgF family)
VEDALLQSGGTAGLIGVLWALVQAIKQHKAKSNGGTAYDRLRLCEHKLQELTEEVSGLKDKITSTHRDLCEFREDVRIYFAKQETREEIRREMQK